MEREEKKKPFSSLPTLPWKARKSRELPTFPQPRQRLGFPFFLSSFNFKLQRKVLPTCPVPSVTDIPGRTCLEIGWALAPEAVLRGVEFFNELQGQDTSL
jgi:hypothetical protein